MSLGLLSPPIPSFSDISKVRKFYYIPGWRVIIVVVQVGAVKIYVGAVEALSGISRVRKFY
jgi:hypothetical protein